MLAIELIRKRLCIPPVFSAHIVKWV